MSDTHPNCLVCGVPLTGAAMPEHYGQVHVLCQSAHVERKPVQVAAAGEMLYVLDSEGELWAWHGSRWWLLPHLPQVQRERLEESD